MTVRKLRRILEAFAPDAQVVVPGLDHSYNRLSSVRVEEGVFTRDGHISEYHGDRHITPYDRQIGATVASVIVFEA